MESWSLIAWNPNQERTSNSKRKNIPRKRKPKRRYTSPWRSLREQYSMVLPRLLHSASKAITFRDFGAPHKVLKCVFIDWEGNVGILKESSLTLWFTLWIFNRKVWLLSPCLIWPQCRFKSRSWQLPWIPLISTRSKELTRQNRAGRIRKGILRAMRELLRLRLLARVSRRFRLATGSFQLRAAVSVSWLLSISCHGIFLEDVVHEI